SCGTQQDSQYCQYGCSNNYCQNNNNNNCAQNSYQRCSGSYLYWYDSCGNQQGQSQYCQYGCSNNYCSNRSNDNYSNCTYHAYKDCVGGSVYWFNSCGNSQDLVQNCSGYNQTCKYGECTVYYNPVPTPTYISHYRVSCSKNSLYWFDSLGSINSLYRTCADTNQCTTDTCSGSKCQNSLKCDGATCTIGSQDYCNSCNHIGDNLCNCDETSVTAPNDCKVAVNANNLSIATFSKKDPNVVSWDKAVQVNPNGNVYFLIIVKNNSTTPVDNIIVSANIPSEVSLLGNLKIDDVPVVGDIVSGVNISSLSAGGSKTITFEGKTQTFTATGDKQAIITVSAGGTTQTDSVTISLVAGQTAGVSTSSVVSSGFMEFLKRWYLWILMAFVFIFLFVVIFRRLSTNVQ
ncbi:MAG: hypothetical protein AAB509_03420, partial [Patescibacteria group bacterium]